MNLQHLSCTLIWPNITVPFNTSEMQDPVTRLQLFNTFQHMITHTRAYAAGNSQLHHFTVIHTQHCVRGWIIHEPHQNIPMKSHISQKKDILLMRYSISWPLIFMGHNYGSQLAWATLSCKKGSWDNPIDHPTQHPSTDNREGNWAR